MFFSCLLVESEYKIMLTMKVKVSCNRPQKSLNNYHAKTVKVMILNNYLALNWLMLDTWLNSKISLIRLLFATLPESLKVAKKREHVFKGFSSLTGFHIIKVNSFCHSLSALVTPVPLASTFLNYRESRLERINQHTGVKGVATFLVLTEPVLQSR